MKVQIVEHMGVQCAVCPTCGMKCQREPGQDSPVSGLQHHIEVVHPALRPPRRHPSEPPTHG